ncbi:MAG: DUF1080 domain-containing protein [Planctomycetes bacterium]|nr:DUF1080 domain-containing protein [Planctomycetota bacterium]
MFRTPLSVAPALCIALTVSVVAAQEIIEPEEAAKEPDFVAQGEYVGQGTWPGVKKTRIGAQVVALGGGTFRAVVFEGGLPGDGWKRGDRQFSLDGRRDNDDVVLTGKDELSGEIVDGTMRIADNDKLLVELRRTERTSPTLGAKPPAGAVVLFDGTSTEHFPDATLSEIKTLPAGCSLKSKYPMARLHIEFRLSWKPTARGQGRSNSGVYIGGIPEIQVLDSFGLEGRNNECGGFYGRREPDVNMCLPPLVWQTYDVEFSRPPVDDQGRPTDKVRVTVRHNGVVIHENFDTRGKQAEPRGIHLQKHGNQVPYGNIWLVEAE